MADDEQHFHANVENDSAFFAQTFSPPESEGIIWQNTVRKIKIALSCLIGAECEFNIQDISFRRYSQDVHDPTETVKLLILDESHPHGLPPAAVIPDLYNPSRVAHALQLGGFQGHFLTTPLDTDLAPPLLSNGYLPPPRPQENTAPWPEYPQNTYEGFTYPPRLVITSPVKFQLVLPCPCVSPLYCFLESCADPLFKRMVGFIYVWTRSLHLIEFAPECIALMVVYLMQHYAQFENTQQQDQQTPSKAAGVPRQTRNAQNEWDYTPRWLETTFPVPEMTLGTTDLAEALYAFFDFYTEIERLSPGSIISIRAGTTVLREKKYVKPESELPSTHNKHEGADPWVWQFQRLVIQDPIIPTYNHAGSISASSLHYFARQCGVACQAMKRVHPLSVILGPHWGTIPRDRLVFVRSAEAENENENEEKIPIAVFRRLEVDALSEDLVVPAKISALRSRTISKVEELVRSVYGRQYSVELFGSVRLGLGGAGSDLDLVVIDPARPNGFSPDVDLDRLPEIYATRKLGKVLHLNGFTNIVAIPSASVPIVKFRDPETSLDCDVNVNAQLGLYNTALLKRYCDLYPSARLLILFVKRWAKPLGLNSPSGRAGPGSVTTFSSYALGLMVVGFLQMRGLLPNLQGNLSTGTHEEAFWLRGARERQRCDPRFSFGEGWASSSSGEGEFHQVLMDWFNYWGSRHDYKRDMMSVRDGGNIPRPEAKKRPGKKKEKDEAKNKEKSADDETNKEARGVSVLNPSETADLQVPALGAEPDLDADLDEVERDRENGESLMDAARRQWAKAGICVLDPFIPSKNVTGSIMPFALDRFKVEARRAGMMLSWGATLEEVLGDREKMRPLRAPARKKWERRKEKGKGKEKEKTVENEKEKLGEKDQKEDERARESGENSNSKQREGGRRRTATKKAAAAAAVQQEQMVVRQQRQQMNGSPRPSTQQQLTVGSSGGNGVEKAEAQTRTAVASDSNSTPNVSGKSPNLEDNATAENANNASGNGGGRRNRKRNRTRQARNQTIAATK